MWTFLLLVVLSGGMGGMSQGGSASTEVHQEIVSHHLMVFHGGELPCQPCCHAEHSLSFSHRFILQPIWSLSSPKMWVEALWEKTCVD